MLIFWGGFSFFWFGFGLEKILVVITFILFCAFCFFSFHSEVPSACLPACQLIKVDAARRVQQL